MWFFKGDRGQSVGVANKCDASCNLLQLKQARKPRSYASPNCAA